MTFTSVGSIAMKIISVGDGVVGGAAALFSWTEICYIRVFFQIKQ